MHEIGENVVNSEDGFLTERDRSIMAVARQLTGLRPQELSEAATPHGPVYHLQLLYESIHAITLLCKVPSLIRYHGFWIA